MSGEYKQISVNVPVIKNYSVSRLKFRDQSIYKENADWLAHWFYTNMDAYTDNILIEITGDFHQTFPNPPHLSVRFKSNNSWSPMYHMSVDQNGFIYAQALPSTVNYRKKGKTKKGKSKKKGKKKIKSRKR